MGWSDDLRAQEEEQARRRRLHASAGAGYDPNIASRVFAAAAKTNLPQELVAEDLDNIESSLTNKTFDYNQYTDKENGSPVFNRFAAENPWNYAVVERNRRNLTRLERTLTPIGQGWDSGWGMIEMANIRDRQLAGDKREGDDERLKELRILTEGAGEYFGVDSGFMKMSVMTAQQLPIVSWLVGQSAEEIMLGGVAGATAGGLYGSAAGPVGTGAGMVGGFFSGMGAGFLAGRTEAAYRLERGLAYDEYSELGFPEMESRMMAEAVGGVNAALEGTGLGFLTKRLPGFKKIQGDVVDRTIENLFESPTFKNRLAKFGIQYGEAMAGELVTEIAQETTLMLGREYLKSQAREAGDTRPEMMPMSDEEWISSFKHIAEATMYGTMLIGAAGPVAQFRADSKAANAAKAQQQHLQTLGEAIQDEKLREEAPEAWQRLLKLWGSDGPVKEFRVRREQWKSYFQGLEIDPDEAAKEMGLNDEQINGDPEDVVIPFDTFVDKIGPTEHFGALQPDIRVDQEGFTQRDAEEWVAQREETTARIEKQLKSEYGVDVDERIVKDLRDTFIARGDAPKAAEIQANLFGAVMTRMAAHAGMDPMEAYKLRLQGVQSDIPESMQQGTTDMGMDPLIEAIRAENYPAQRDIFGDSLIDMIKSVGKIKDEGGELAARDFGKAFRGAMSEEGLSFDAIAELAYERGYITEYDQTKLLEAIDRELAGTQVFSRTAAVNEELNELRQQMEQAAQFMEQEGIDIKNMSNEEVRKAIQSFKSFDQSDLEGWTRLFGEAMANDPELLLGLWSQRPRIGEQQDFSSVTFTDKFVTPNGKTGTYTRTAQEDYDKAVNERNVLKQLMDCVNG